MACPHDLEAEYLYPADAAVVEISDSTEGLHIAVLLPCPDCDQSLRLETTVDQIEESNLAVPLDDSTDLYD